MVRILSTGTAFDIAATTGDAGQLGMVAGFDGYFSGLISRPMQSAGRLVFGDFPRIDLFKGIKGSAPGGDRLWFRLSSVLMVCLSLGNCLGWRYPHYSSQHSVSQH